MTTPTFRLYTYSDMCGRYSFGSPQFLQERVERANLALDEVRTGRQSTISFNVSPGRWGPVYRETQSTDPDSRKDQSPEQPNQTKHVIDWMKWGLIPSFSDEPRIGSTFNCRSDSLAQHKGLWTGVKQFKRCVVLAEGYYEWQKKPNSGSSIPHFVKRKDGQLMLFAGLWDSNSKVYDQEVETFTVITTDAHKGIQWLHDRMPVILPTQEDVDKWLRPGEKWNEHASSFMELLKPFDAAQLEIYQVSPAVGKLSNDYPELTQPLKDAKGTITSFFSQPSNRSAADYTGGTKMLGGAEGRSKRDRVDSDYETNEIDDNTDAAERPPKTARTATKAEGTPNSSPSKSKPSTTPKLTPKKSQKLQKAQNSPEKNQKITSFFKST